MRKNLQTKIKLVKSSNRLITYRYRNVISTADQCVWLLHFRAGKCTAQRTCAAFNASPTNPACGLRRLLWRRWRQLLQREDVFRLIHLYLGKHAFSSAFHWYESKAGFACCCVALLLYAYMDTMCKQGLWNKMCLCTEICCIPRRNKGFRNLRNLNFILPLLRCFTHSFKEKQRQACRTDSQCGFCGCVALSKPSNCSFALTSMSFR